MKNDLVNILKEALSSLGVSDAVVEVEIPENEKNGEYTTNVAMRLASKGKGKSLPAGKAGEKGKGIDAPVKNPPAGGPMEVALQVKGILDQWKKELSHSDQYHSTSQRNQTSTRNLPHNTAKNVLQDIERIEVAPPGFINFYLSEAKLGTELDQLLKHGEAYGTAQNEEISVGGEDESIVMIKNVMVEFAHPNTHKAFHIGHLRNISTGESLVRLLESQGVMVVRANYQGDVGMHISKALYGLTILLGQEVGPDQQSEMLLLVDNRINEWGLKPLNERIEFLGKAYAQGSKLYEESNLAKAAIGQINKVIYAKGEIEGFEKYYQIYLITRQWSLDYFESIYKRVDSHFDRYYFESETYESGKKYVLEGVKEGIFEKSDGAVIFPGEKYGLHSRVFITSEGNATYEGKDVGLVRLQIDEHHPDLIIHVLGPEQHAYTRVLFKALELVFPDTKGKQYHLVYGWVKLKNGKMSSRTGNVVLGEWLIDTVKEHIHNKILKSDTKYNEIDKTIISEKAAIAAVKYSFLRVSTTQEISFDIEESVNVNGDSGPYLQYTYARARSVLRKAEELSVLGSQLSVDGPSVIGQSVSDKLKTGKQQSENGELKTDNRFNPQEHALIRLLVQFPEIVAQAASSFAPSTLCSYLFHLAQAFNLFYAKHQILVERVKSKVKSENAKISLHSALYTPDSSFRLSLTAATAQVLKNGLSLLGIETLEQM